MITTIYGAVLVTMHYCENKKMHKFVKIYYALWNHSIVVAGIVSSMYWLLIYKGQAIDVNNVLIHALNSIVLVFDLFVTKIPPSNRSLILPIVTEVLYAAFTAIYQLSGGLDK